MLISFKINCTSRQSFNLILTFNIFYIYLNNQLFHVVNFNKYIEFNFSTHKCFVSKSISKYPELQFVVNNVLLKSLL